MATGDLAQYLQALQSLNSSAPPRVMPPARWPVWDLEDTSRWGNQITALHLSALVKPDPMKAMG